MDITSYLLGKKNAGGGGGGGSGMDWTALGYQSAPPTIDTGYTYGKNIYDNWVNEQSFYNKYDNNLDIVFFPSVETTGTSTFQGAFNGAKHLYAVGNLDTSSSQWFSNMFYNCTSLCDVPIMSFASVSSKNALNNMFYNCVSLSDNSVDNIMQSCITATSYTGTKSLAKLGFTSTMVSSAHIQTLPHYQDFTNAGWSIGY